MIVCECDCGCEAYDEWHSEPRCACRELNCPCVQEEIRRLANALKQEVRDYGSLDWKRTDRRFLNAAKRIMRQAR